MNVIKLEHAVPQEVTLSLTAEAIQERQDLLDKAQTFQTCLGGEDQGRIIRCARSIKALIKDVEAFRKKVTKPYTDFKKLLDDKCKAYVADLEKEEKRLAALTVEFQRLEEERVKQAELERLKEMEAARIAARKAEEAAKAAKEAVTKEDAGLSEFEQAALAEQEAVQKAEAYVDTVRAPAPKEEKVTGQIVRKILVYEVKDIKALYEAFPQCVNLIPNKTAIREYLEAGHTLPGVEHHWEKGVSVRA